MLVKILIYAGLGLIGLGFLVWILSRFGITLGKMPFDFSFKKGNMSVNFPLGSSLLISLILTLVINLFIWIFRK